jgi:hypothetical protein
MFLDPWCGTDAAFMRHWLEMLVDLWFSMKNCEDHSL